MTIDIVGLGPGSSDLITKETARILAAARRILLRTRRHPTVDDLDPDGRWPSCDDLYDQAHVFDEVYARVADRVMELARRGDLVFAVPGHPLVAERAVLEILRRAGEAGIPAKVHSAVSFVDAALEVLNVDGGDLQICDALDLRIDAQRPALVGQVYGRDAASALKLRLMEVYPAEHKVQVLRHLGTERQTVSVVPLSELDYEPYGYLDCVYVPPLAPEDDLRRFDGLFAIIERLHAPGGCPWDREQTHESLRPHLLEETYELLEAIDSGEPAAIAEELGDVLLQVLMHAAVAKRLDEFSFGDVTEHIGKKLIRRHPHVFGDAKAETAEDVRPMWEQLKKAENPDGSILEGVPASLPALAASQAIQGRARRIGFDWPDIEGPLEKLREELAEFARAEGAADREDEFGDILFVIANVGQRLGIDAEQALRRANEKFRRRFSLLERLARERGIDLSELDLAGLDALWDEAKAAEARL
ncbi:MAG: nucleoside triphosphate pyrophosphohydrolase [Dehalococcoidia bacterium]